MTEPPTAVAAMSPSSGQPPESQAVTPPASPLVALPDVLFALDPRAEPFIVTTRSAFTAAGAALEATLAPAGLRGRRLILERRPSDRRLTTEPGVILALKLLLDANPHAYLIALGSGTIHDIVKLASPTRPYLSVPTAPTSLTFASAAALLASAAPPPTLALRLASALAPHAILIAPELLAAAPPALVLRGATSLLAACASPASPPPLVPAPHPTTRSPSPPPPLAPALPSPLDLPAAAWSAWRAPDPTSAASLLHALLAAGATARVTPAHRLAAAWSPIAPAVPFTTRLALAARVALLASSSSPPPAASASDSALSAALTALHLPTRPSSVLGPGPISAYATPAARAALGGVSAEALEAALTRCEVD